MFLETFGHIFASLESIFDAFSSKLTKVAAPNSKGSENMTIFQAFYRHYLHVVAKWVIRKANEIDDETTFGTFAQD